MRHACKINAYRILIGMRGKLKDLDKDDNFTLKWNIQKHYTGMCSGFGWLKIGSVVGTCEESNEPSELNKGREIHTLGTRLLAAK